MDKIDRQEILDKARMLANIISQQEEVEVFQKAEIQIEKHERVQTLVNEIKRKQQELVNAKHLKKSNYIKQLEDELDQLNAELHGIPLVKQYQQSQTEINRYLQEILGIMKLEINKKVPLDKDI